MNFYNAENDKLEILKSATVWFVAIIALMIVFKYFRLKKSFYSSPKVQEVILYTFNDENFQMNGETFEMDFSWKTVYRVRETRGWFLIYKNKRVMHMIPKENFSADDIAGLRTIISNNELRANLRRD